MIDSVGVIHGEHDVAAAALLDAWLGMELSIRANRVLGELTFNQMAVCHVLEHDRRSGGKGLSAASLCTATSLLKSQMNKELSALEALGLVTKGPDETDRRKTLVSLDESGMERYRAEHARVMALFGRVVGEMGEQEALDLAEGLRRATTIAGRIIDATQ